MSVEDVFFIKEKGVVVTGVIDSGKVTPGDTLERVQTTGIRTVGVVGVEHFGESLPSASAGKKVGIQLADLQKADVDRKESLQSVNPK